MVNEACNACNSEVSSRYNQSHFDMIYIFFLLIGVYWAWISLGQPNLCDENYWEHLQLVLPLPHCCCILPCYFIIQIFFFSDFRNFSLHLKGCHFHYAQAIQDSLTVKRMKKVGRNMVFALDSVCIGRRSAWKFYARLSTHKPKDYTYIFVATMHSSTSLLEAKGALTILWSHSRCLGTKFFFF